MTEILYQGQYCDIIIPDNAHITVFDGGHLVIKPHEHVNDTAKITDINTIVEIHYLKAQARLILTKVHADLYPDQPVLDFFNEQENGNWSAHKPLDDRHAHIHVYGRSETAKDQTYGSSLNFSALEEDRRKGFDYSLDERAAFKKALQDLLPQVIMPQPQNTQSRQP